MNGNLSRVFSCNECSICHLEMKEEKAFQFFASQMQKCLILKLQIEQGEMVDFF